MIILFQTRQSQNWLGFTTVKGDGGARVLDTQIDFTLAANRPQQTHWAEYRFGGVPSDRFYAACSFRFPRGYQWPGEHKLVIVEPVEVGSRHPRLYVNARGKKTPTLAIYGDHWDALTPPVKWLSAQPEVYWPDNGAWHTLELEYAASNMFHVYLDGQLAAFANCPLGGTYPCGPLYGIRFGAYSNEGSPVAQTFSIKDVIVATERPGVVAPPVKPPPVEPVDIRSLLDGVSEAALESQKAADAALLAAEKVRRAIARARAALGAK